MIGRNARGQVTIDGVARFPRLIYDSGFAGANGTDMAGHVAARNYARFAGKLDLVLHTQSGTLGNTLRLCDALLPYRMHALTVGNAHGGATVDQMSSGNGNFDVVANPSYNGVPFRQAFLAKPNCAGVYLADEPADSVLANLAAWQATYKAAGFTTLTVLIGNPTYQYQSFGPYDIGDWIGEDEYPVGAASELNPGSPSPPAVSSYGYMNFRPGEAAAGARYIARLTGKTPVAVLQHQKFGSASRFLTNSEMWSHMVMALAELRGVGVMGWWAWGIQASAVHSTTGPPNWTPIFTPAQVTQFYDQLDLMTSTLAQIEPVILRQDEPERLSNSLSVANPVNHRKGLVATYNNGAGDRPCWLWGEVQRYGDEAARLAAAVPDLRLSAHMLDQAADVRTASWEDGNTGVVASYNLHPDPRTGTLKWWRDIAYIDVLGENRVILPAADQRSWTDTWGGGSSLRQGSFNQGHLYRLVLRS